MSKWLGLIGLRTSIAAALALASAGTAIFLLLGTLWIVDDIIDQANRRELLGHYEALLSLLQQESRQAEAMSAVVASMPPVQQAMAHRDRTTLMEMFDAGFAELKSVYDVEQFQFHTAPATSFLRVHQPEKFGDDLSSFRATVVAANATNKPVLGLESGIWGLGIRGVVPIDLAGRQVGTVEFGLTFGQGFFVQFKQIRHVDIAFHLRDKDAFKTFGGTLGAHSFFAPPAYRAAVEGGFQMHAGELDGKPIAALLGPVHDVSGTIIGVVEIVMDNTGYVATVNRARALTIGIALSGLLAASLLGWLLARGIARPILGITDAMRALAQGDRGVAIPDLTARHEIGEMARAVAVFKQNGIDAEQFAVAADAARTVKARRQAAMEQQTQDFGKSISGVMTSLADAAGGMHNAAEAMAGAATEVHEEASGNARGAAKSSQDLTVVAAAIEELTQSVGAIAHQVAAAADVARQAVQRAEVSQGTMQGLTEATARIGDIVRLISSIASQTNLLALNATIEAARAGDAGKGFAVVASEVKALAEQTAKATAEIGAQIETVRGSTGEAVAAMTDIGAIIGKMDAVTASISGSVDQQNATTREIAANIQMVSGATAQTAQAMAQVVTLAGKTGMISRDMLEASAGIGRDAETLRVEVDQFLAAVRDETVEQRQYERISGNGATVGVRTTGRPTQHVELKDMSRGGAALVCDWTLPPGAMLEIDLPNHHGPVPARVVRTGNQVLAAVFGCEPEALRRIDAALEGLSKDQRAA